MNDNEEFPELQHPFLNALRRGRRPVAIFLHNAIRLDGVIQAFDQYAILLSGDPTQIVYKHLIASVMPEAMQPGASHQQASALKEANGAPRTVTEPGAKTNRDADAESVVSVTYRKQRPRQWATAE